ncbi:MAG TPA: TonB-dependent receptor, partial [Parvularcula sp.]|nr:TonB-dependent receptor [Parvularcula sp.]
LENPILKGFPVFDLDRIEILKGPQGTLFGRNTPAGVIKFESARPTDEFEGYGRLAYGRFNTVDAEGAVSGPLADTLSARLSALYQRRDDFVDNQFAEDFPGAVAGDGADGFEEFQEFAGRLQFLWSPNADWSTLLNIHGRRLDGGSRL